MKDYNQGNKAGRKSRSYNLGTEKEPIQVRPGNFLDLLVEMEGVAEEDIDFIMEKLERPKYYLLRVGVSDKGKEIDVIARISFEQWKFEHGWENQ
jgi:hypothetical protein